MDEEEDIMEEDLEEEGDFSEVAVEDSGKDVWQATTIQKVVNEMPDSIEISTPKVGAIKCYGNADDFEGFKRRLDNMIVLRIYAQKKMEISP